MRTCDVTEGLVAFTLRHRSVPTGLDTNTDIHTAVVMNRGCVWWGFVVDLSKRPERLGDDASASAVGI